MSGISNLAERFRKKSENEAEIINQELEKGFQALKSAISTGLRNGESILSKDMEVLIETERLKSKELIDQKLEAFRFYQNQAENSLNQSLKEFQETTNRNNQAIQEVLEKNSKLTVMAIFRTWLIPLGFVLVILLGMIGYGMYQAMQLKNTYQEISRANQTLEMLSKKTSGIAIRNCTVENGTLPCVALNPKFKDENWTDNQTGETLKIINTRK